jgi:hypothetical protein
MTKQDKLEAKIRNNPSNVSLTDFEALVNNYGHIKMGGKHAKACIGQRTQTYKRENPMKADYVMDLLEMIDNTGK